MNGIFANYLRTMYWSVFGLKECVRINVLNYVFFSRENTNIETYGCTIISMFVFDLRMINMSSECEYDWYWKISACSTEYEICDSLASLTCQQTSYTDSTGWYFRNQSVHIQITCPCQHGQSHIWGGATGSDITGPNWKWRQSRDRKYVLRMLRFFPYFFRFPVLFSYYISSTKCSTLVQVPWLLEVTERHMTPKRMEGCAHAQPEMGPFHRKWRHQASRDPWNGGVRACATWSCVISDRKCSWDVL